MNLNGSNNKHEMMKHVYINVTFKVRHSSGYANIKSENWNAENNVHCSTIYSIKSSNIITRNSCFPEIIS